MIKNLTLGLPVPNKCKENNFRINAWFDSQLKQIKTDIFQINR